jgi:hypothetical protein
MILRGLTQNGFHDLAHEIGINRHTCVIQVFQQTGTVWENYAPDAAERGDISRGDFVGWTGLSPTAILFEYVFGLRPDIPHNCLTWDIHLLDAHGVTQYPFGSNGLLDLHCEKRALPAEKPIITVHANLPLTLEILWQGGREMINVSNDKGVN